jgi:hypothetical protein
MNLNFNQVYRSDVGGLLNCECTNGKTEFKIIFMQDDTLDIYLKDEDPGMRLCISFSGKDDWRILLPKSSSVGLISEKNNVHEFVEKIYEAERIAEHVRNNLDAIKTTACRLSTLEQEKEKTPKPFKAAGKAVEKEEEHDL